MAATVLGSAGTVFFPLDRSDPAHMAIGVQLPHAFAVTIREFLLATPVYLLNSPMLPQFKRDADGGLTLLIQNESPGKNKEANWLSAPKGPFSIAQSNANTYAPTSPGEQYK